MVSILCNELVNEELFLISNPIKEISSEDMEFACLKVFIKFQCNIIYRSSYSSLYPGNFISL